MLLRERPFEVLRLLIVAEHADIGDILKAVPLAVDGDIDGVSARIIDAVVQVAVHDVVADRNHFSTHVFFPSFLLSAAQPLTEPAVMPRINCFCISRNSVTSGVAEIVMPASSTPQSVCSASRRFINPAGIVRNLSLSMKMMA